MLLPPSASSPARPLPQSLERTVAGKQGRATSPSRSPGLSAPVTSLCGGNQQKVVLGARLLTEPSVLLLDEPTRGIDVGAKAQIAEIMSDLAAPGYGVLFVSSEFAEVMAMADRVLVMARGHVTAEFSGDALTEEALVAASASDRVLAASPRRPTSHRPPRRSPHEQHRRRRAALDPTSPRRAGGSSRGAALRASACCCSAGGPWSSWSC